MSSSGPLRTAPPRCHLCCLPPEKEMKAGPWRRGVHAEGGVSISQGNNISKARTRLFMYLDVIFWFYITLCPISLLLIAGLLFGCLISNAIIYFSFWNSLCSGGQPFINCIMFIEFCLQCNNLLNLSQCKVCSCPVYGIIFTTIGVFNLLFW
jgi:hypothetical protein